MTEFRLRVPYIQQKIGHFGDVLGHADFWRATEEYEHVQTNENVHLARTAIHELCELIITRVSGGLCGRQRAARNVAAWTRDKTVSLTVVKLIFSTAIGPTIGLPTALADLGFFRGGLTLGTRASEASEH